MEPGTPGIMRKRIVVEAAHNGYVVSRSEGHRWVVLGFRKAAQQEVLEYLQGFLSGVEAAHDVVEGARRRALDKQ